MFALGTDMFCKAEVPELGRFEIPVIIDDSKLCVFSKFGI